MCHQHATGDLPSCLHNGLAFLLGISKTNPVASKGKCVQRVNRSQPPRGGGFPAPHEGGGSCHREPCLPRKGTSDMAVPFKLLAIFVAIVSLATVPCGFGQTVTATLTGTVTDSSGSAIPGASVVLTNQLSGDIRKTTS